jgi:hypothetical protein
MDGTMPRKKRYCIHNWPRYNKALVNRGSFTVRFDEESIAKWHHTQPTGQRGRPYDYSNTAKCCALTLRNLFRLPLRATDDGMIRDLMIETLLYRFDEVHHEPHPIQWLHILKQ